MPEGDSGRLRFADLVATSAVVGATRARTAKVAALADLLRRCPPDERATATAFLVGAPRQGKIGVGWARLRNVEETAPADEAVLTVTDVDEAIDALAALGGPGSVARRAAVLDGLVARATGDERDFLVRLLLGDLRQGALEGVMADAVATAAGVPRPLVRRAAMLAGDLPSVAELALGGGEAALAGVHLRPLVPVLPMLAATAASVEEAMVGIDGPASVEWKLDGARVQAHRLGDEVRLLTRNLNDVTARLPALAALVRALPVRSIVLDGEVLGSEAERPEAFSDTMSRFSRRSGDGAGLGVWFFDVLHLDGTDLLDRPLVERAGALAGVVPDAARIPATQTDDAAVAQGVLESALAAGHEGVVVKDLASPYEAGRRGSAWRKVKPVHTLDLVVLGAEWGYGRRQGWLSNLHLGARQNDGFAMVGKTFKGLTDDLLRWQTEALLAIEDHRDGIAVLVRPELVVEVAVDGVQSSTRYPGGVALRFARVRRYRPDKTPAEADTIEAVRTLLPGGPR